MAEGPISVFFDNDQEKIEQFENRPKVVPVKIDETPGAVKDKPFASFPFYAELKTSGNTYLKFLETLGYKGDTYDDASGVTGTLINEIDEDYIVPNASIKYAIFDWDRTLTKFEGFFMDRNATFAGDGYLESIRDKLRRNNDTVNIANLVGAPSVTAEDMLLYLFGGAKRLGQLRGWMTYFQGEDREMEIIILTNNGSCLYPGFRELVDAFAPKCRIVCSKPHDGNKETAMLGNMPEAITGGRRRRKTLRSNRMKRRRLRTRRLKIGRRRK
jgi:hypothetical protein